MRHLRHGWKQILMMVFIIPILFLGVPTKAFAAMPNLHLKAESVILIEATTGKILYKKNENIPLPPASMTKMMTEYLVLEAIEEGKIDWDTKVRTSPYAGWMGKFGGSKVYLVEGSLHTIRELYEAMAVASGNDATVALAELVGGTETGFVQMMNEKAKEFGMTNTHFRTSSGYPVDEIPEKYRPNIGGEHVMSARDSAILARRLVLDYPEALEISKKPEITFTETDAITFPNWNYMVPGNIFAYKGMDGLKTGHTDAAGYCFTGTAKRGDMRLISVVMRSDGRDQRFHETRSLLNYGFTNFEIKELIGKGKAVPGFEVAPVAKGIESEVKVKTAETLKVVVKKGEEDQYQVAAKLDEKKVNEEGELIAPIKKGSAVGTVSYVYNGEQQWEYITSDGKMQETVALAASQDVEKAGWFRLFFRGIGDFIGDLFGGMVDYIKGFFS